VAPGEAWGLNTITAARRAGFTLFNSWGLCHLQAAVPSWTAAVTSPYLNEPDPVRVNGGLPTIGYWHDRDMAVEGPEWVPRWLDAWRDAGVTRAWPFSRLARIYAEPVEAVARGREIIVHAAPTAVLVERAGD
jgi:hypothetical protein